jgi:hypothetical protein
MCAAINEKLRILWECLFGRGSKRLHDLSNSMGSTFQIPSLVLAGTRPQG